MVFIMVQSFCINLNKFYFKNHSIEKVLCLKMKTLFLLVALACIFLAIEAAAVEDKECQSSVTSAPAVRESEKKYSLSSK